MIEPAERPAAALGQPTILLGCDVFGLRVLRRLLTSTAGRGVLRWHEPRGGRAPGKRRLQDLALLWVPGRDVADPDALDAGGADGTAVEMMRDVYQQIDTVPGGAQPETAVADALAAAAEKLLSAADRATRAAAGPLGLDVIVLTHPLDPESVGRVDRLLEAGAQRLGNNANLMRAVQGAEALNFIQIADFDNYWDTSDAARRRRAALRNSIDQWQRRRVRGQPAFGRFYFVDGRTRDGFRDERTRIDEICLFLEFLLFEGQRAGRLQRLYQPALNEWPVGTFGIRLMERSSGLLSRLAAAAFGIGWVDHLAGSETALGEAARTCACLEPFRPSRIEELFRADELRRLLDAEVEKLTQALAARPAENPHWPQVVKGEIQAAVGRLAPQLSRLVHERMAEIAQGPLARLREGLGTAVTADLTDSDSPAPLGHVLGAVQRAIDELNELKELPAPRPGDEERHLADLKRAHEQYLRFREDCLDPDGLRQWWWLFALLLSVGLVPFVQGFVEALPPPDPLSFLAGRLHAFAGWFKNPLAAGVPLFLTIAGLGLLLLNRRLAARLARKGRIYTDAQRGRLVDRLRAGLERGGALRAPLTHLLEQQLRALALNVRADVSRQLVRVAARLRDRQRELDWLRRQLQEFMRLHGLTERDGDYRLDRPGVESTGIRFSMEGLEDFQSMLATHPPGPGRYRATGTAEAFAGWDHVYCSTFLSPMSFIDNLSRVYRDPLQRELAHPESGPQQERRARELHDFLRRGFDLAFRWQAQEGVPADRRFCLLPALWRQWPGVLPTLTDVNVAEDNVLTGDDAARAYLLRVQHGVESGCLVEGS